MATNLAAARLLGQRIADWPGLPLAVCLAQAIVDPAHALCWAVALSQALACAETTYLDLPTEFRTGPDSAPASLTGVVAPWACQAGREPGGAVLILHGSAQHESLAELRTRFLSVVSHELSSPITNITAAAEQLARQMNGADPQPRRLLAIIQDEAARFRRLIGQFLVTPASEQAVSAPARQVVALRPILERVAHTYRVREPGREIRVEAPPDLPFVEGDPDRIHQILTNLIDNALRYSPHGTPIVVATEASPAEVVLSVTDEGGGIADADRDRIFEPFFRGGQGDQPAGQGVGLYVARSLALAMGGDLWHERESGRGARFCFTLPQAALELEGG